MAQPLSGSTAETTGFPLSRPLVNGSKVGSFFPVLQVAFEAATDTVIPVRLGRLPSGYIVVRSPAGGGQVTDASDGAASWTPMSIVLQATVAGSYSVLVF